MSRLIEYVLEASLFFQVLQWVCLVAIVGILRRIEGEKPAKLFAKKGAVIKSDDPLASIGL